MSYVLLSCTSFWLADWRPDVSVSDVFQNHCNWSNRSCHKGMIGSDTSKHVLWANSCKSKRVRWNEWAAILGCVCVWGRRGGGGAVPLHVIQTILKYIPPPCFAFYRPCRQLLMFHHYSPAQPGGQNIHGASWLKQNMDGHLSTWLLWVLLQCLFLFF